MLKKHNKHGPLKWFAGVLVAAFLLTALPYATPVYAAGDTGNASTAQTGYVGFSAVSDVKVNNVSVKRYGHYSIDFKPGADNVSGKMKNHDDILFDADVDLTNQYTRTGYHFIGWKDQNGVIYESGKDYTDGKPVHADVFHAEDNSTYTLTAQWTANTYTVSYKAGIDDPSGSMGEQTMTYDDSDILLNNGFTKTGYQFTGWKDDGGKLYDNMDVVRNLSSTDHGKVTLTAQWKKITPVPANVNINAPDHKHDWKNVHNADYHWEECVVCGVIRDTLASDDSLASTGITDVNKTSDAWKAKHAHHMKDWWTVTSDMTDPRACSEDNYHEFECEDCDYSYHNKIGQKPHGTIKGVVMWTNDQFHCLYCYDCREKVRNDENDPTVNTDLIRPYLEGWKKYHPLEKDGIDTHSDSERDDYIAFYHYDQNGNRVGADHSVEAVLPGTCAWCGTKFQSAAVREYTLTIRGYDNTKQNAEIVQDATAKLLDMNKSSAKIYASDDNEITYNLTLVLKDKDAKWTYSVFLGGYSAHENTSAPVVEGSQIQTIDGSTLHQVWKTKAVPGHASEQLRYSFAGKYSIGEDVYRMTVFSWSHSDLTPPEVSTFTSSQSGSDKGWASEFSISASGKETNSSFVTAVVKDEDGNEIINEHVPVNDGKWSFNEDHLHLNAAKTGTKLTLAVTDAVGNTRIADPITIRSVDTSAPVLTNPMQDTNWHKSVDYTVKASEAGVGGVKIGIDDKNTMTSDGVTQDGKIYSKTFHFTGDDYEGKTHKVYLVDALGHLSATDIKIGKIDGTAPTVSASVSGNKVTVSGEDAGSGVTKYGYLDRSAKSTKITWSDSPELTLPAGRYWVFTQDLVGNRSGGYAVTIKGGSASAGSKQTIFDWGEEE